jgi:DNA-binding transcriptional regulator LsrR (DeoR family)
LFTFFSEYKIFTSLEKEMARLSPVEELRLLTKVSKLYYEEELNQDAIMDKLQLSRAKVSRLLKEARDRGIVKISVSPSPEIHSDLEVRLENRFALKEAIVVDINYPNTNDMIARELGAAASGYIQRVLKYNDVLGISWGTTINYMVSAMQFESMPNVQVVQVIGGLGPAESEMHATDICRRLARTLSCKMSLLPAPGIVKNAEIKKVYLMDDYVQKAMNAFANLTIAVVGIGAPTPNSVMMRDGDIITNAELNDLTKRGAIGDIALRFFDVEGNSVKSDVDERVIGVSLEKLSHVQRVVGVAGGAEKEAAVRAALLGKLVNVLITDQITAKCLLDSGSRPRN